MPFSGEHERPLELIGGEDGLLTGVTWLMAATAAGLTGFGGWAAEVKLLLALAVIAVLRHRPQRALQENRLRLRPDGASERAGIQGRVLPAAWVSDRYTVVRLVEGRRIRPFLICASRQTPGEYRKLLACLRLGRWRSED
jgi:hypothetical protein